MRRKEESILVRKSMRGDTAAFGEIIRRYQHLVFAAAFQVVKDPALAEDVAQEAFVTTFRSLKDLREENAFPAWLRKITRNRALASLKEQGRFVAIGETGLLQSVITSYSIHYTKLYEFMLKISMPASPWAKRFSAGRRLFLTQCR